MHKVNIIIPVHNRWEHTKQTLESLVANTDPSLYMLDVVDDASSYYVKELLGKYFFDLPSGFPISLRSQDENIGPAATRNLACKRITDSNQRGQYLYHSDNDVFFAPGWLERLINVYEHVKDYGIKLLGGGCHPYLQSSDHVYCDAESIAVGIKDAVSGYSQFMTWETWDTYGPFDEGNRTQDIKIMGSEDWAFCQRIIKDGFRVGSIEPEVVIATGKTNTYGQPATGNETFKNISGIMIK